MASVRELKEYVGNLLAEPKGAVNSRSMMLVKAGLLSSDGVGKTTQATAADATNLILGFMGGSAATAVADNVELLRSSAVTKLDSLGKVAKRPAIKGLKALPKQHTLGEAMDALIAEWTAGDLTFSDTAAAVSLVEFSIVRDAFGWNSKILVFSENAHWEMNYVAIRPAAEGIDPEVPTDAMIEVAIKHGDRKIEETITSVTFSVIANLLRSS